MRPADLPDAAINAATRAWDESVMDRLDESSATPWTDEQRDDLTAALLAALPHLEAAIRADERRACASELDRATGSPPTMWHESGGPAAFIRARLRAGEQTTTTPRERRCTCTRTVPTDPDTRELDPACPWHGRPSSPTTTKDER